MGFFDRWRKRPPEPPQPARQAVEPKPVIVNPAPDQELAFAQYRIDAICRDREQRLRERRNHHPQHHQLTGEALMYAGRLIAAGVWTHDHMARLRERLGLK